MDLLLRLIIFLSTTLYSQGQDIVMYFALPSLPGTLIGDLDTLSHPQLIHASNAPYTLLQTRDSDKVTLASNLLSLFTTPDADSMYSLSISHLSGTLNISLYFLTNQESHRPYITPDVVQLSVQETTPIGSSLYNFKCTDFKSDLDISHSFIVEYYLTEMLGLFNISNHGDLQVNSELSALETPFVPILISCIDPRAPYIEAHAAVTINITSSNTSALTCVTPISVSLCENQTAVTLSEITCYHPVYQYASSLRYSISDGRFKEENSQLLLDAMLDYEESTSVQFQITVSDPADPLLSAVIEARVSVLPVNEFTPGFTSTEYHVSENQVAPPPIKLLASDMDHGLHGEFIFQLVSIDSNLPFSLSEDGTLTVLHILDHEGTSDYKLDVELTDRLDPAGAGCNGGNKSNMQRIQVQIDDVNEQPFFLNAPFTFEVLETVNIGAFIGSVECSDPDNNFVDNGRITYSLVASASLVSIEFTNGVITLISPLDFTTSSGFTVDVRCEDLGNSPLQDISAVTVSVSPVIAFEQTVYTAELAENSGVGTFIQKVSLSLTSHSFNSLSFSLSSDPTNGVFAIDSVTGILTLDKSLLIGVSGDRHQLTVRAMATVSSTDGAVSQAVATTQLSVTIVNDTYVYFPTSYSRNVSENVKNVILLIVSAINNITSSSEGVLYTLLEPSSYFQLNNVTGELVLISPLDRETQSQHTIPVIASDMYNTSIRARTDVLIYVLDLNDITPTCVNSTERYITGHYFATPHLLLPPLNCTDLDAESPNNEITFSLLVSSFSNLSIDSANGRIFGVGNLTLGLHDLSVVVSDRGADPGPLSTTVIVKLHVTRNDFYPQFLNPDLSISLFENNTLIPIINIMVSDEDTGPPGDVTITYKVQPTDDDVFAINATTGVFSLVAPLDYERTRQYIIEFNATDNGRPQKSNTTTLILIIINLNDESPYCGVLPTFYLDFDNHFPDFLYQLQCSDPDNLTDLLLFSIDNTSNASIYFSISNDGVIQTISSFENLTSPLFPVSLPIPLRVGENNSDLVSHLFLNVLLGESGFPFEFQSISAPALPEDSSPGTLVATFTALHAPTQPDLAIRYSIRSVSQADVFNLDSVSGELSLSVNIDFETVREYDISIRAVDNATYLNLRILSTVIYVVDICDNPPTINHTQPSVLIPQGTYSNLTDIIHTFPCSDLDAGNNGAVSCSVSSTSPLIDSGTPFFVMSGCDLILNRKLNGICEPVFTLQINCTDLCDDVILRTSSSFQFQVQVQFENLERPKVVSSTSYPTNTNLFEDQTVPKLIDISEEHFIDEDCSPFNQTFFSINHTPPGYMISDKFEGRIVLNRTVDYDKDEVLIAADHRLRSIVKVFDCEELLPDCEGQQTSTLVYLVYILDVNDNLPQCLSNSTRVTIPETASPNVEYPTSVLCYDIDRSNQTFGMVYFEIVSNDSEARQTFEVFSTMHSQVNNTRRLNLRLLNSLDYENTSQYVIQVRALDGGTPPLYSEETIILTVDVANINEHRPFFSSEMIPLALSEGFNISNIVHNSTVIDLDHAPEDSAFYQLSVAPDEKFQIDNITGEITLSSSLDREMVDSYLLVIYATETTLPLHNHTATQTIIVTVNDVNDNFPTLTLPTSPIQIQQNVSLGGIHTFPCTDKDLADNSIFDCDITSPVYGNSKLFVFSVESQLCRLLVNRSPVPNCSVALTHDLDINCTDRGTPSLSGAFSVSVVVNLENLQDPLVSLNPIQLSLSESTAVPSYLVNISQFVSDGDCQNFGQFTFSIQNQLPTGSPYATLSPQGDINLIRQVDFDDSLFGSPPSLQLEVLVQDNPGGSPMRETKFNVTFMIKDSNDNPPTCTENSVTVSIEEESLSAVNLSTICYDIDSALNGELDMVFASDHDSIFLFSNAPLNSSHSLISIAPVLALDFELTESYTVQVQISDRGTPPMNTTISVTVLVTNINDNTPVFTNIPTTLSVVENASPTLLFTISASDLDKDILGQVTYSLISVGYNSTLSPIDLSIGNTSQFEVGLFSGELIQLTPIDFESDFLFQFGVLAQDFGSPPKIAKAYFNITIENVNEFAPQIVAPSPATILQGAVINTVITFVQVSDGDRGDTFSCYIHPNSVPSVVASLFNLNHTQLGFSIVLAQPVVCNDQLLYQLFIICNDSATNSLSSSIIFNTSIISQNLNIPVTSSNNVSVVINENELINTIVFQIPSILFDPDCARNGSYRYSILYQIPMNHNYLDINALSGSVFINGTIDYESEVSVVVAIQVQDDLLTTGPTFLPTQIHLTASITDLNDNPPICNTNDSFSIPEAMSPLSISTNIFCTDRDSFSNTFAQLSQTSLSSHFSVEMIHIMDTTFQLVLTVTNDLDYETITNYDLQIIILDPTRPEFNQTVNIAIEVLSVNENTPFIFPTTITMVESRPVGYILSEVSKSVIHSDHNESLIYSLSQSYPYAFALNPNNGTLTLNTSLDFENPDHRTVISTVVITDTGVPPRSSVPKNYTIKLTDANDNPPRIDFINNQDYFQILQSQSSGIVANLSCSDADTSLLNTQFNCSIDASTNPINFGTNIFLVMASQPICYIVSIQFPPCVDDLVYNLTLNCQDTGDSTLKSSLNFRIHLIPENLTAPVASGVVFPIIESGISESQTVTDLPIVVNGTNTIATSITDSDCGIFGQIFYRVDTSRSNNIEYVTVDNKTGLVTIFREVDKEVLKSQTGGGRINIFLDVLDNNGEPGFRKFGDTNLITIDIQDDNDEAPICNVSSLSLTLLEESRILFRIPGGKISCIDRDSCPGAQMVARSNDSLYNLRNNSLPCVNDTSVVGEAVFQMQTILKYNLEIEKQIIRNSQFTITDGVHTVFINVTITILDKPEFPTVFTGLPYSLNISYTAFGVLGFSVTAIDEDFTSQIMYSSTDPFFSVDSLNGTVSVISPLNSTNQTTFQVIVTARDSTTGDSVTAQLDIVVNHPPSFLTPSSTTFCVNSNSTFLSLNYTDNNLNTMGQDQVRFYFLNNSNPPLNNVTTNSQILLSAVDLDDFSFSVPSEYTLVIEDSTGYTDAISFNITRCARRRRDLTATPLLARYERDIIKSLHFSELTKLVYLPITYQMGLKLPLQFCMSDLSLAISYSLLLANHSDWPFVIGSASGEIEVFRPLYRLTYHLVEQCSNPLHEQIASYVIVVLLETDYTPVFNESSYTFSVPESAPIQSTVGAVLAETDRRHAMSYTSDGVYFDVRMDNGRIILTSQLDFETRSNYNFSVTAVNADIHSLLPSNTASVTIIVTDVNDNAPEFIEDYDVKIYINQLQDNPIQQVLQQVHCIDADLPETNQIEYSLETPHLIFGVTPSTGYLYIRANPQLLSLQYSDLFIIRCTDQTHLPKPVLNQTFITVSIHPHSLFTCNQVYQFNVTWPKTEPNATASVLCPQSSKVGTRVCSSASEWQYPDLSECSTIDTIPGINFPVLVPGANCYPDFISLFLSKLDLIKNSLADSYSLHLAGDLKLSIEYFLAAEKLLACMPISVTALHSVALSILQGIDLLTKVHFSDAWLTLGGAQPAVSSQLVYLLNSLTHRLIIPNANSTQSILYSYHQNIATELHPDPASSIHSPYLFTGFSGLSITLIFTSCYLQSVPAELGLSYLNDTTIFILNYLPPHVGPDGRLRSGVSTGYVGLFSSGYHDNGQECRFNQTFAMKEGTEDHLCAVWEFSSGHHGSWNPDACLTEIQTGGIVCSCKGVGVVGVIGTTPPIEHPNCFPLADIASFFLFILSSAILFVSIAVSITVLVYSSRKHYRSPLLYFKLHTLCFLLLAEISNFIGIFVVPFESVCYVISIITHDLFVFVFCWLLTLSLFQLLHILFPKKEATVDKFSLALFFAGYAFPLGMIVISLIDIDLYGVLAPPATSQCRYLYCWVSARTNAFPTSQLISSAIPLSLTQLILSVPLFLHFFIPESESDTNNSKPSLINTKLSFSQIASDIIPGFLQVYLIGFHYSFLSNAHNGVVFGAVSFLFALLTSVFLLVYYTGIIASFTKKNANHFLKPKHSIPDFVSAGDYEMRIVTRQHERVNWAFLNVQEDRFYEEGRQLGAHFNIAVPNASGELPTDY